MFRTFSRVSILIGVVIGADVSALGLGGLRTESALNQPYAGEIDLYNAKPDELDTVKATLASADDFAKSGLDRYHFLTNLVFQPMLSPRGGTVIRVTSEEPIREPFVDFLVEVQWPEGRLVKGYTVLLDPPEMRYRRAARTASPATADPRPVDRPAPQLTSQQAPQSSRQAPLLPGAAPEPASRSRSAFPKVPVGSDGFPITFGPVRAGQGLLALARSALPQDATADQTAMALYRNNQDAFVNGDINGLTVGKSLVIPTQAELFALDAAAAERELRAALEGAPVRRTPITDVTQREAPEPEPAHEGPPRIAGAAGPDVSQVPADGSAPGPGQEQLQHQAGALQPGPLMDTEAIARADRQTDDLQERILQLETELEDIQRVLEQRDAELVVLRQATSPASDVPETSGAAATAAAETAPEQSDATPRAGSADVPAEPSAPALGAADPATADATGPMLSRPVLTGPLDPDSGTPVEVTGQPAKSTWHAYLLPLAGFAGVTALGVVAFSLMSARRRRQEEDAEEEFEAFDSVNLDESESAPVPPDADAYPVALTKPVGDVKFVGDAKPLGKDDFGFTGRVGAATDSDLLQPSSMMDSLGHFDTETDEADALSEADIYIAYGRYNEAEELLKREVNRAPERLDIRFKLAEVYASADNLDAMQQLMQAMKASRADVAEPALWQRLGEVARAAEQRGVREPTAAVSKTLSAGARGDDTGLGLQGVGTRLALPAGDLGEEDSFSLDLGEGLGEDLGIAPLLRTDARPVELASNVAFKPASNPGPARTPAPDSEGLDSDEPAAGEDAENDLPLLFDESALDDPLLFNQDSEPRSGALGTDSDSGSEFVLTLNDQRESTQIDLDAFLKTPSPFGLSPESEERGAVPDLDLPPDFDLPAALDRSRQQSVTQKSTLPTLDIDDFEIPDNLVELADDSPASQWPMDTDIWDDNATKLDLARAYIDMDDSTAAREILEEVISAGRDEQRIEAEALLRTLT